MNSSDSSIKIVTYNIHKGFSTAGARFVLDDIREKIRETGADLVMAQEIQGEHTVKKELIEQWPEESQFEFLADSLWPHYAYGKNAIYRVGHHGNAILSKFPFEFWENINVSRMRKASRSILHGRISIPGWQRPLHTICVHFGLFQLERRSQVRQLVERVSLHVPDEEPLIVAGDFNDWSGQVGENLKKHLGLSDTFVELTGRRARSFPSWLPILPLDRIYFRGLEPINCQVLKESREETLSDHLALMAEFSLAKT